jgi:PBP1b-binding outer membrane lipoprotein LpoB
MKIALLLSIACAALVFSGCRTHEGATVDTYSTSGGVSTPMNPNPAVNDPSLPQDPNVGPQIVPP